jgi:flagellar motor switch protein FliG
MRKSLKRKYAEHAAEVLRKLGLKRPIPTSADNPALAACGILIAEFPPKAMNHVLSELPTDIRDAILEQLLNMDALFSLDSRSIQKLLREIPRDVLALALQGVDAKRLSRIFENLSSGGADVLRDEIEYAAGTEEREVAAARRRVGEIMRDRYVAGEIPLPGSPGGSH